MRPKLSTFLLKTLIWILCTHSMSYASILTSSSLAPLIEKSILSSNLKVDPSKLEKIKEKLLDDSHGAIQLAENIVNNMARLEKSLGWSEIHVLKDSPAHGQLIENSVESIGIQQNFSTQLALVAVKASQNLVTKCLSFTSSKIECAKYLTKLQITDTKLQEACNQNKPSCDTSSVKYRSVDGSCNHQSKGYLGKSFTGYRRILFPNYSDGISEPKTRSDNKKMLPSPRLVSVRLTDDLDRKHDYLTLAVMQWSQFVLHDLAHTATSKMLHSGKSIVCCDTQGKPLAPRYIHPFCLPIEIPRDDPFYSKYYVTCMSYVRSTPAFNSECTFGPLNIMNQATHYLDASQIYGSTPKKSLKLREFEGGRLIVSVNDLKEFLPHSLKPLDDCQVTSDKSKCYRSGDIRVNLQPYLTAMHLLWHREHNRIARELERLNPNWNDEKLYQESRKIVIAEIQHITYTEWVEILLGPKFVEKLNLVDYNEEIDPSVSNSFASAAMKFTNSLIDGNLKVYDEMRQSNETLKLHENFFRPDAIGKPGNLDGLIRGLATQSCQKYDLNLVSDVTERLYAIGKIGFDVLSLDIQRGRDHGLPSYLEYREFCGLPKTNSFEDLKDYMSTKTIDSLKSMYSSPADIDLIVGGLAEKPFYDSLLGPTFTCLISEQLYRTRLGDRFFYTNEGKEWSFLRRQLDEIKKVRLSTVFCNNGNDIKNMQPEVFHVINERNKLVPCETLPQIDLNAWKEK